MLNNMIKNKTAQAGDTITWLVATVVIIVVLSISVFASSFFFDKNKILNSKNFKSKDTLASKSLFSYVLTKDKYLDLFRAYSQTFNMWDRFDELAWNRANAG